MTRRAICVGAALVLLLSGCGDDIFVPGPPPDFPQGVPVHVSTRGWRWADLRAGTGAEAAAGKRLTIHYTMWVKGGAAVETTRNGQPATFTLGAEQTGIVSGLHQTLPGMKVGGTRLVELAPELAYGEAGRPPSIPAFAFVIVEVRLLSVE